MNNKEKMKASRIVRVMSELLWLAISIGIVAFVTWIEAWCARLCIQNDINFYVTAFMCVYVTALVVYFEIKVHKKWARKYLY